MSTKLYDISNWCKQGAEVENYPYIGEIDIDANIHEVIKIGDSYYSPRVLNLENKSAGVKKVEINLEPEDEECEDKVTCPYCGYTDEDSWELEEDDDEHECGRCGAIMSFQRVVTVEYNSYPVKPPDIVNAEWV